VREEGEEMNLRKQRRGTKEGNKAKKEGRKLQWERGMRGKII
jgi:hypothetical protein